MKKIIIKQAAFAILLIGILSACASSHLYKGDRFYDNLAYAKAIKHYEKVYDKSPTTELGVKLADSYFKTGDLKAAETVYEKLVSESATTDIQSFNYAKVLMANNKYDEATDVLTKYLKVHDNDAVAHMLLSSCNSLNERYIDTTLYELKEIPTNGLENSFSVTDYQDGIVFVADKEVFSGRKKNPWTGESYLDLYEMKKNEDGSWMTPELFKGDINGRFHEGPATFSEDGKTVYFTRSNYYKRKMEVNEENENNLKIFRATLVDDKWTNLEEMPFNSDDHSVGHPSLSACCNTLYFISDMPGGFGGTDIYRVDLVEGNWGEPENLGSEVNTAGNEMFPYYDEDGALYFSSDAHTSMGGLDVFMTYFTGERWVKPENLNYPVNSQKDDFSFIFDKEKNTGFISSSRTGTDEIYEVNKFAPTFNLIGFTHEKGNKIAIEDVTVDITDIETGDVTSVKSDAEGNFKIKLMHEKEYFIQCSKFGYFAKTDSISTKGLKFSEDFYRDFALDKIVIDKPIVLENIYYDFDKWAIREDAAIELDKLVTILKDNPSIEIEMGSHTDSRGPDKYNQVLSAKRAYATVQYLEYKGIDSSRLTWKGYGETELINNCGNNVDCSEEDHQLNRRTEFKVTKINKE